MLVIFGAIVEMAELEVGGKGGGGLDRSTATIGEIHAARTSKPIDLPIIAIERRKR
jgi:hypothetical protein